MNVCPAAARPRVRSSRRRMTAAASVAMALLAAGTASAHAASAHAASAHAASAHSASAHAASAHAASAPTPVPGALGIVSEAPLPSGTGYWAVTADGTVLPSGGAVSYGDLAGVALNEPIVSIASTWDGRGYWLVATDGGIFDFGDARFHGSTGNVRLNRPIVGMAATRDGGGYWLVAADGGIFEFGDAHFYGSTGNVRLNRPIVGMAAAPGGAGYWLVAADGGIFDFGDARFYGSTGNVRLNQPVVGMAASADGSGYWLVAADGGIFDFGDARFDGSGVGLLAGATAVGMISGAAGYWILTTDGALLTFGRPGAALPSSGPVFPAAASGAVCDGVLRPSATGRSADGVAIQAAIDRAEAYPGGGTVLLPAGHCMVGQALMIGHGAGITFEGTASASGAPLTTITDPFNSASMGGDLDVYSDHNTVRGLVLDQSSWGGAAIVDANHTTLQDLTILGGPNFYALSVLSPDGTSVGNRLLDSTVVSLIDREVLGGTMPCDVGLVWANQADSLIQGLQFTGTRLGLYHVFNSSVDGFTYRPGPQSCGLDGFYITQPSNGLSLSNLIMYGSAGVISNDSPSNGNSAAISIAHETVLPPTAGAGFRLDGPSHGLILANVQDVTVEQSDLSSGDPHNSSIEFQPTTAAYGVVVVGTVVPTVGFWAHPAPGSSTSGRVSGATFRQDTFPATPAAGGPTFVNGSGGPASFAVIGGSWGNQHNGFLGGVQSATTYTVSGLAGY